ncbi:hypothetical protein [Citrobacter freundii]|uniref:hypothetical protein n=1 Tax=Citrobacter freundii TaxID=546 RepID=UPI001EEFDAA3|nr:hypothetical protein [Citrobacter freundii]
MWLISMLCTMMIVAISILEDVDSSNIEMHTNADVNQEYNFLKLVSNAVTQLKSDPETRDESQNCLNSILLGEYIPTKCLDYGVDTVYSFSESRSPLYIGDGKWKSYNIGSVVKGGSGKHTYYYIYADKGHVINNYVYSLIPKDKFKIVGFDFNGNLVTPSGFSSCRWSQDGEFPCLSIPHNVREGSLVIVL